MHVIAKEYQEETGYMENCFGIVLMEAGNANCQ